MVLVDLIQKKQKICKGVSNVLFLWKNIQNMSMFDMMGMMGKVKEMQSRMQEAQEKLADITAEGESGGGMVKVVVNGKKELVMVEIEPVLLKPEDAKMVQDLIVAASNIAMEKADILAKQEMSKITDGIMPKIPGLDLGDLFKK